MPLYEYSCEKCEKSFELIRNISDKTQVHCPVCDAVCRKNVSTPSFQLKGSGWYKTDYASSGASAPKSHGPACGCCSKAEKGTCGA